MLRSADLSQKTFLIKVNLYFFSLEKQEFALFSLSYCTIIQGVSANVGGSEGNKNSEFSQN